MRRLLAIPALAAAIALGAWLGSSDAAVVATAAAPETIAVHLGDRIRLVDAPIGCRVVRMSQLGGRVVIDCRRAGPLAGTYGTLFSVHEAAVVHFESRHAAKMVVVATHNGEVRRCE